MKFEDYYAVLEISHSASAEEIKRAYRKLVRDCHPDTNKSAESLERFRLIQTAYDTLSHPERKKTYDVRYGAQEAISTYQEQQKKADTEKQSSESAAEKPQSSKEPAEEDQRWKILQAVRSERLQASQQKQNTETPKQKPKNNGTSGSRGSLRHSSSTLLKRLRQKLDPTSLEEDPSPTTKRTTHSFRRGSSVEKERFYQFSLSAFESLSDSFREIALKSGDTPKVLRVKIPAGVEDGATLKINCPATEDAPARTVELKIRVLPDPLIERKGRDLTLKVPISISEALNGCEIDVPGLKFPLTVRIPTPWRPESKIKLSGQGLRDKTGVAGDLTIQFYLVLPELTTKAMIQAAQVFDEFYSAPVRRSLPRSLTSEKKG